MSKGSTGPVRVTLARGDGIGPEIADATVSILEAAGANLAFDEIEIGEAQFLAGHSSGIAPESWKTIRANPVLLKAPITTPLGGGYKSLNVTIRKTLNLFANVRPTKAYFPFVKSRFPNMDVVVIRENEEDLYAGIEHQQTPEVAQVLKLITRPGSERIVRYAFNYARAHGRKRVTCMTKSNIMKHTDGLFARVFQEISSEYPDIESDHQIIDIGAARVAHDPESFDVIVTLNLYGDIISDITSQIAGSVGLAGSANIGERVSMFEAVHGSAPDIAGKGIANPSGLLAAATQMLVHVGQVDVAERIANAWLATLESGAHPADIYSPAHSKLRVGTRGFADGVIANLGRRPGVLKAVSFANHVAPSFKREEKRARPAKALVGVDAFIDWEAEERDPELLARDLREAAGALKLKMITNRGVKVWPQGAPETFCTDHWRCRFVPTKNTSMSNKDVIELLARIEQANLDVIKTENLYTFDGNRGYSFGQGE